MRSTTSRRSPVSPVASTLSSKSPFVPPRHRRSRSFRAAEAAGVVALEAMRPLHDPAFHAIEDALGEIAPSAAPHCALASIPRATTRFSRDAPPISSTAIWHRVPSWTLASTPSSPWSRFSACPPALRA